MSSTVCLGLHSCLEPPFLNNKLVMSRSNLSNSSPPNEDDNQGTKDGNLGDWSFIKEAETIYIHPMTKNSSSFLSEKSLNMCTECLGSETGSETSENIEELIDSNYPMTQRSKLLSNNKNPPAKRGTFPPPLSSIRESKTFRLWPHREDGRLLIKKVTVNSSNNYFQKERCDGRLKLLLYTDGQELEDEDEEEMGIEESSEIGTGDVSRISRCNDGGNEMSKWRPFRVPIS